MKNYIPIGVIENEELISLCASFADQRPDFIPAFDALIKARSLDLYDCWLTIRADEPTPALLMLEATTETE